MGVSKYVARNKVRWRVDTYVTLPDGTVRRLKRGRIPTREQAQALEHKLLAEAYEGRFFDRKKEPTATVRQLWTEYEPITKRDNDSWQSDVGRGAHLVRLLGDKRASRLTRGDVEEYRMKRQAETSRRGEAPSPATLDREVELLKRLLNYAAACGRLAENPIARVKLLRVPNTRRVVLDEEAFQRLSAKAEAWLRPILLVAFDTGMRKSEVLNLRWSQIDLKAGAVRLEAEDTKTDEPRVVYLTERVLKSLSEQPRLLHAEFVFVNPATGRPWQDIQGAAERARDAAGLSGRLGPRPAALLRHPGAPQRPTGVGGGPLLRPPDRGGVQALQHRRGAGSQGCGRVAEPHPEGGRGGPGDGVRAWSRIGLG